MHMCTKAGCKRTVKGYALKKAEARTVWLYTLDEGSLPAYAVHLYCEGKPSMSSAYASLPILVFRVQDHIPSQFLCVRMR